MTLDDKKYNEILAVMEKRAYRSKWTTLLFVYALLTALISIPTVYIFYKADRNKTDKAFASLIMSSKQNESALTVLDSFRQATQEFAKASEILKTSANKKLSTQGSESGLNFSGTDTKSTFEKAVETAAPYFLFLSGLLFVGYILRLFMVFIKYNMQMSNDYENQRISFLLSQGNTDDFSKIIQTLREHNISFEKTPNLPQEKIIVELIDLLRTSKAKG